MRLKFNQNWMQNALLIATVLGAVYVTFLWRDVIESKATPELFFYTILAAVVLLAVNVLYTLTISSRVEATAAARTEELLETQRLFVELYRNSPVPYVMVDPDGTVTYPNHAALRLFGLKEDTFEGRNIFEMFEVLDDEDGIETSMVFARFSKGVFVDGRDVSIKRADGAIRFGLLSIFPYGGFGAKKKGLMTIVDITKQKEIEQAKTEFVSLASHQLRTPISSMKWNLELMHSPQFGSFSEKQEQFYVKIETALDRMNALIDDFLNVSQLELGTKEVNLERIGLRAFFDDICDAFAGRIAKKGLTLTRNFDERIGAIETDRALLHMAVSNLVSNATKYTPEGGKIAVQYTAGAETVSISVLDDGVGIPAADQEQLFSKFFRAKNVRERVTDGTGLGLYIVKLAIEQLGGTIQVRSKENVGTAFDIVLPYSSSGRML